ncbi:MAG: HAMP domain-containing histidine kinase [Planctomycetales bacterium]|nr:HAMP domain-containing histidine kinase [Planctomycetales bacterium]
MAGRSLLTPHPPALPLRMAGWAVASLAVLLSLGGVAALAAIAAARLGASAIEARDLSGAADMARLLAAQVERSLADRAAADPAKPVEPDPADARLLAGLHVRAGVETLLADGSGHPVGGPGGESPHPCLEADEPGVGHARVHESPDGGRRLCVSSVVRAPDGRSVGRILFHGPARPSAEIEVLSRDLAAVAGTGTLLGTLLLLAALRRAGRWERKLRRFAEDQRRRNAAASVAAEVADRLAARLPLAERDDPDVADLLRAIALLSGRSRTRETVVLDLGGLVREWLHRSRQEIESSDRLLRVVIADGVWVRGDPGLLGLAIGHLLRNAAEALEERPGRIEVSVGGGWRKAEVRIRDTGPGIPAEIRRRLFDPGATTRPGRVGFGLAVAHRIAEELGGRLDLSRAMGGGCVARLTLPRASAPKVARPGEATRPAVPPTAARAVATPAPPEAEPAPEGVPESPASQEPATPEAGGPAGA